jgi:arylsulfatase A-like enzyme
MPAPEHLTLYDGFDIREPPTLFDDYSHRAGPARLQKMEIARHMTEASDLKLDPSPGDRSAKGWEAIRARFTEAQRRVWDAIYDRRNWAFREANLSGRELVRAKYQRYIKDYLRCVASVDDNVGRVLRYLDETGLAQNTVVIYSSDQGFYLGEHGWFDKRWMYEESLRTPLIVRWPGVAKPSSVSSHIVSNLDFPETFLDIAHVDVPSDMQGRSLVPLLKSQPPDDWRRSFYYHYYESGGTHNVARHYGVRTGTHKLIHYYETGEWELFDLTADPRELRSVHGEPRYATIQKQLLEELTRLRQELKVPDRDPDK